MKRRIGIVTCFKMDNVNYGNRLQAFALNRYLRNEYPDCEIETLNFGDFQQHVWLKRTSFLARVRSKLRRMMRAQKTGNILQKRLENCNKFSADNICLTRTLSRKSLEDLEYDVMVTGSDIVWYQKKNQVKPIMFLDFKTRKPFKKVSYAASFGNDYIPEGNEAYVKKVLADFSAISVREKSSLSMLEKLGFTQAEHCIDSTLLLGADDWKNVEEEVQLGDSERFAKGFIFVYLLGDKKSDRERIAEIAANQGLAIITVPYARGWTNEADQGFGDLQVMDCSPGEWIWLIHHSRYVITDSFHGVVFSAIFNKRFIAVDREEFGINNRLKDFLTNINETDKFVSLDIISRLDSFNWDYEEINRRINEMVCHSKQFIQKNI